MNFSHFSTGINFRFDSSTSCKSFKLSAGESQPSEFRALYEHYKLEYNKSIDNIVSYFIVCVDNLFRMMICDVARRELRIRVTDNRR